MDTGTSGLDVDSTGQINIATTKDGASAILLKADNGGIDITATGASSGEDINVTATGSSINITSTESDANAIKIIADTSAGGIKMDTGTSGLDIDSTGEVNIASSKNGPSAIVLTASTGGVDITATGASAEEDINITATGSSVNITSTENVSDSIVI